jgi:hypothetical protein
MEVLFWVLLFVVFYSYLGYGVLLFLIIKIRRTLGMGKPFEGNEDYEPEVTLFVAAYNEKDYVDAKIQKLFRIGLPKRKSQTCLGNRWL